jgi:hypothetical protein
MTLSNETPSAMLQEAYSIPYEAYQSDLLVNFILGGLIGAALAFLVAFVLLMFVAAPETPFERYSKSIKDWDKVQ